MQRMLILTRRSITPQQYVARGPDPPFSTKTNCSTNSLSARLQPLTRERIGSHVDPDMVLPAPCVGSVTNLKRPKKQTRHLELPARGHQKLKKNYKKATNSKHNPDRKTTHRVLQTQHTATISTTRKLTRCRKQKNKNVQTNVEPIHETKNRK